MSIHEHLEQEMNKEILRFSTAGSVDDGKSTLIGRLLHDSKNVYEDQVLSIKKASKDEEVDYALLTDGLKAEREQGITIDVAYRYFATAKRKFIIADTPGHEQYTRNMATGASTADLTIILIDARKGVLPQSKRHAFIASLLQIPHLIVAVNKMDLVDYSEEVFTNIKEEFSDFAARFQVTDIRFVPISALKGDNVVDRSQNMTWFQGESLLELLDTIYIGSDRNLVDMRYPVQYVSRPNQDFRGYCGQVASGVLRVGDEVMAMPSMKTSRVKSIVTFDGELQEAYPPLSVNVTLEDEIDISRGDMLVYPQNRPQVGRHFEAMTVWMGEEPLDLKGHYYLKQATTMTRARISDVTYRVDINTLNKEQSDHLAMNEIGRIVVQTNQSLCYDTYRKNRATGSFILVDAISNATVAAGMIIDREPISELPAVMETDREETISHRKHVSKVSSHDRVGRLGQRAATVWLTGPVSSGKSEVAYELEQQLFKRGAHVAVLHGGLLRGGLSRELSFNPVDVAEHLRRTAEIARLFNDHGQIVICSLVSPSAELRKQAKEIIGEDRFLEVHIDAPTAWCRERDETGLYAMAEAGEVTNLAGVNTRYEVPANPDLRINIAESGFAEAAVQLAEVLSHRGIFPPSM